MSDRRIAIVANKKGGTYRVECCYAVPQHETERGLTIDQAMTIYNERAGNCVIIVESTNEPADLHALGYEL